MEQQDMTTYFMGVGTDPQAFKATLVFRVQDLSSVLDECMRLRLTECAENDHWTNEEVLLLFAKHAEKMQKKLHEAGMGNLSLDLAKIGITKDNVKASLREVGQKKKRSPSNINY